MTNRPDYSGAVVGTAIGLVQKGLFGLGTAWFFFLIFVLLFATWWAWVVLGILVLLVVVPLVISELRTRKSVKAHEQRHREKYGKEPIPWKHYPIHRKQ